MKSTICSPSFNFLSNEIACLRFTSFFLQLPIETYLMYANEAPLLRAKQIPSIHIWSLLHLVSVLEHCLPSFVGLYGIENNFCRTPKPKIGAISDEYLHIFVYFVRVNSINKVCNALPIRSPSGVKNSHNSGRIHFLEFTYIVTANSGKISPEAARFTRRHPFWQFLAMSAKSLVRK